MAVALLQCFQNKSRLETAVNNFHSSLLLFRFQLLPTATKKRIMNSVNDDGAETAKRARLETKFLRKRFSFHRSGPAGNKQNQREKSDREPATTDKVIEEERESDDQKKVAQVLHDDDEDKALERLAAQELLQEAARAKVRADVGGPSEYKRKPVRVNRRFVVNSLLQTQSQNKRILKE